MLHFNQSNLFRKVLPLFSFLCVVPYVVFAGPPDNGPDGIPAGGRFSIYFSNMILGNDGVSGSCPTDQVIVGFNTGLTLDYGKPICQRIITLPDATIGQTLRYTGTGWVSSSLIYNNGTNIGVGVVNPFAKLDVNGSLFTRSAQVHYDLGFANSGSMQWVKVGTLTAPQGGTNVTLRFFGGSGFSANSAQNGEVEINFRTSNGSTVNANGFCASARAARNGRTQIFNNIKFVGDASGCLATSYDLYLQVASSIGVGYYTVDTYYGSTWNHSPATAQVDPGVASSTVLVPDFENVMNDNLSILGAGYVSGNFGIGNPIPSYKLDVTGTGQFTGFRLPTGASNNYILTSDASGNARWVTNNYTETDPQVGANTTNYIPKWDGTSLVTGTIFDNGNIGIGTGSPGAKLEVSSNGSRVRITQNVSGSIFNGIDFYGYTGGGLGGILFNQSSGEIKYNAAASYFPTFYANGSEVMRIATSNNVGIGNTNPLYKLDVTGTGEFDGLRLPTGAASNYVLSTDALGNVRWMSTGSLIGGVTETDPIWISQKASYATLASPIFTGDPRAPTAVISDSDTSIATTAFVKSQGYITEIPSSITGTLNLAPLFKLDLLPNGTPPVRTASTTFKNIQRINAPFVYGQPLCPTGTTQQYKVYAELIDNILSAGGQNVAFRIALDGGTNIDFNMLTSSGSTPDYHAYLSGLFTITNANNAWSQIRINGSAGPYVELRNAELWTYCIH